MILEGEVKGKAGKFSSAFEKIIGQKAGSFISVTCKEAQAHALDIREEFEEILNSVYDGPAKELINLAEVQSNIFQSTIIIK
ncbi:MAG: hypothetical protein PV340_03095 [Wolbachia sp.]|nr:hypothetical protein [Wolbachia sp.]